MSRTVDYTVTYLEMRTRPSYPRPHSIVGLQTALLHAEKPPVWYFLSLYDAVGGQYHWTDRHNEAEDDLRAYIQHPAMALYTLIGDGWPAGFFMLDSRQVGVTELVYFGLVPEAVGRGLGKWLLQTAVHTAWDVSQTERIIVDTCTLDHPAALPLYQKMGFVPIKQTTMTRQIKD